MRVESPKTGCKMLSVKLSQEESPHLHQIHKERGILQPLKNFRFLRIEETILKDIKGTEGGPPKKYTE